MSSYEIRTAMFKLSRKNITHAARVACRLSALPMPDAAMQRQVSLTEITRTLSGFNYLNINLSRHFKIIT